MALRQGSYYMYIRPIHFERTVLSQETKAPSRDVRYTFWWILDFGLTAKNLVAICRSWVSHTFLLSETNELLEGSFLAPSAVFSGRLESRIQRATRVHF